MLQKRLHERYYTSVADFSRDLSQVFNRVLEGGEDGEDQANADINAIHNKLNEVPARTAEHNALSHEQKELKKLAKRIVKAVRELLEAATRKEAQLRRRDMDEEIRRLDSMGIFASGDARALTADGGEDADVPSRSRSASLASAAAADDDIEMADADADADADTPGEDASLSVHENGTFPSTGIKSEKPTEPISPPISRGSAAPMNGLHALKPEIALPNHLASLRAGSPNGEHPRAPTSAPAVDQFRQGGVPWYLAHFEPVGTTVHEEVYTGRAVLRDMSEELSDMDEDTLTELAPLGGPPVAPPALAPVVAPVATSGRSSRSSTLLGRALQAGGEDAATPGNNDSSHEDRSVKVTSTTPSAAKSAQKKRPARRAAWSRPRR